MVITVVWNNSYHQSSILLAHPASLSQSVFFPLAAAICVPYFVALTESYTYAPSLFKSFEIAFDFPLNLTPVLVMEVQRTNS